MVQPNPCIRCFSMCFSLNSEDMQCKLKSSEFRSLTSCILNFIYVWDQLENCIYIHFDCKNVSFWTDRSRQTVQTQIRLLLEEQGLHCLQFWLHLLGAFCFD